MHCYAKSPFFFDNYYYDYKITQIKPAELVNNLRYLYGLNSYKLSEHVLLGFIADNFEQRRAEAEIAIKNFINSLEDKNVYKYLVGGYYR